MGRLVSEVFEPLPPVPPAFGVTAADVLARSVGQYAIAARDWARVAWEAWSELREGTEAMLADG